MTLPPQTIADLMEFILGCVLIACCYLSQAITASNYFGCRKKKKRKQDRKKERALRLGKGNVSKND